MQKKDEVIRRESMACPPIQPLLIQHLKQRFQPARKIRPDHPQLQQLLMVQYGVEKVIDYLEGQYDRQSLEARKAREI
jgi:hypothetical protein